MLVSDDYYVRASMVNTISHNHHVFDEDGISIFIQCLEPLLFKEKNSNILEYIKNSLKNLRDSLAAD